MAAQVPLVDYLVLGDDPHLVASECAECGARYFDRRNACAHCSGTQFKKVDVAQRGTVRTFTIVAFAAPGIPVPFVARIAIAIGPPRYVARVVDAAGFEALQGEMERELKRLYGVARDALGKRDR